MTKEEIESIIYYTKALVHFQSSPTASAKTQVEQAEQDLRKHGTIDWKKVNWEDLRKSKENGGRE